MPVWKLPDNPTPLTEPQRQEMARWYPLAIATARPWTKRRPDLADEYHEAALAGLVQAVVADRFTAGLVRSCVTRRCFDVLRYARTPMRDKLKLPLASDPIDPARDDPDEGDWARETIGRLPPRERAIVHARIFEGCSATEAAARFGMSPNGIKRACRRVYAMLRDDPRVRALVD